MRDEHLPDRGVDGTAGQPRRPQGFTDCVEEQLADHHVLARGLVEQRQFGVLTEVRAAEVERRHRALDLRKRGRQARAFGHRYDRLAAPERELGPAECLRCGGLGNYEPPETTPPPLPEDELGGEPPPNRLWPLPPESPP